MSFFREAVDVRQRFMLATLSFLFVATSIIAVSYRTVAQEAKRPAAPAAASSSVVRGQYIVENVAMCPTCHTPRLADGELDRSRWLTGAPVPYLSARSVSD